MKAILCGKLVVSRFFEASICITLYGVSVPSLHRESTDSLIYIVYYMGKANRSATIAYVASLM